MPNTTIEVGLDATYGQIVQAQAADADILTTGRRAVNFRRGFNAVLMKPDADAARVTPTPTIRAVYHYDDTFAGAEKFVNLLGDNKAIIDSGQTGAVVVAVMATADFIYIGTTDRVGGFRVDLDGTILNNNAATMTAQYSSPGGWATLTIGNDGTATGGATLGLTIGNVTWTAPAAGLWGAKTLKELNVNHAPETERLYWVRLITSATLDNVEIEQIMALHHTILASASGTADGAGGFFEASTEYNWNINDEITGGFDIASQHATNACDIRFTWLRRG